MNALSSAELRKFTEAGNAVIQAAGVTLEQWAEAEAPQILSGWVALVNAQTEPQAEKRARNRVLNKLGLTKGAETINSGVRGPEGRVWIKTKRGKWIMAGVVGHNAGAFVPTTRHMPDDAWGAANDSVQAYQGESGVVAMAKRTIGLARQSIIQIGDALGYALERFAGGLPAADISRARAAVAGNGQTYQNGFGVRQKSAGAFSIELINRYPNLHQAKIDSALAQVVGGRIELMEQALGGKLGTATQRVAAAFPYLQVVK